MASETDDARLRRWHLVLPHRPYLVRIAARRGMSPHDAEDCAQEAMLRCVAFDDLDESRVLEFLATTTMRLCVDRHRLRVRDEKVSLRLTPWYLDEPSPEERACERGEAAWVATHVAALPASQRRALAAKAEGLSGEEIAARLGLSYKAVESLLSRARACLRAAVASAYVLLFRLARRGVRAPEGVNAMPVVALVAVAALVTYAASPLRDGSPPRSIVAVAGAPGVSVATRALVVPAAAQPGTVPVPRLTPRPSGTGGPGGPGGGAPIAVPTDPCDAHLPFVETCVPVQSYSPGQNLDNCVRYGPDLSHGFECRDSPSPAHP